MNWREYIHSDPEVLADKPVVRGTRLAVDFLLGLFAAGWTQQQVLESYPALTPEALRAVFAFAAESMRDESFYAARLEVNGCGCWRMKTCRCPAFACFEKRATTSKPSRSSPPARPIGEF